MKRNVIIFLILTLCVFTGVSNSNLSNTKSNSDQHTGALLDSILNYGLGFMGTPYHFGSPGPRSFDCSGFTSYIYRHFGYNLEHDSRHQARNSRYVRKTDLQKGDLVFFTSRRSGGAVGHVGIVYEKLDNGEFRFIHASTNQGVTISSSDQPYYAARFVHGGRIVDYDFVPLDNSPLYAQSDVKNINSASVDENQNNENNVEFHIVKRGESLNEIAEKYDVPVITLKQMNGLKSNRIKKGMKLKVGEPSSQEMAEEKPIETKNIEQETKISSDLELNKIFQNTPIKHKVQKGETLYSIARDNNVSVEEIKQFNNLKSNNLSQGQLLSINKTGKIFAKNDVPVQTSVSKQISLQSSNADLVSQLKNASNNKIFNGAGQEQQEKVVEKVIYTKPLKHKVKKGETLSEIADNNNISLSELKRLNHISTAKIKPGKELIVKEGKRVVKTEKVKSTLADNAPVQNQPEKSTAKTATVKSFKEIEKNLSKTTTASHKTAKGETLYDIARNNNITVEELKRINNLTSDNLKLGQVLVINQKQEKEQPSEVKLSKPEVPVKKVSEPKSNKHKVEKGETLYDIARENDMTVDELKELNGLSSDKLKLGQVLDVKKGEKGLKSEQKKSDKKEKSGITTHVVKNGESLYSIRKKYGCKLDQLKKWNNLSGESLKIGQKLIIYQ